MDKKRDSKYTLIALLLISVLLHLVLVVPFITIQLDLLPPSPLLEKLDELHQEIRQYMPYEEWAAITPAQGAPVIIVDQQDMPEAFIQEHDNHTQEAPPQEDMPPEPQPEEPAPTQEKEKEEPQPEEQVDPLETVLQQEVLRQPPQPKPPLAKKEPTVQKQAPQQSTPPQKIETKPKLTLAQLAEGFAHHMEQEGDLSIAVAMAGKNNAKATESQLRVGRFLQKVLDCIKTSWVTQKRNYPLTHPVQISIHFNMSINKDGTLHGITLTQSSGSPALDAYIAGIIKDASSSFPPIPDYLNWNICTVRCDWDNLPLPNTPIQFIISQ